MRLFGLMMVCDGADLLAVNLRHHLAQGIERFLVLDHASCDDTPSVLERWAATGTVQWARVDGPFRSHRWVNDLAREAFLQGADWVLPIDVDELWMAEGSRIVDVLASSGAVGVEVGVVNFVQQHDQEESTPEGLLRMDHRVGEPAAYDDEGQRRVEDGELPFVALGFPRKWICRASATLHIGRGNHSISGLEGPRERRDDVVCLHAPLRSREALSGRRRPEAVLDPELAPGQSWQQVRWVEMDDDAALAAEWAANSAAAGRLVASGMPLVVDTRLRDAVLPLVRSPPDGEDRGPEPGGEAPHALGAAPVRSERARLLLAALREELDAVRAWGERRKTEVDRLRTALERTRESAERRDLAAARRTVALERRETELARRSKALDRREQDLAHRLEVLDAIRTSRFFRLWMASIRLRRWRPGRRRPSTAGDPSTLP